MEINFGNLHPRLRAGVQRWIEEGILPGHFLTALMENDLSQTIHRADSEMIVLLTQTVSWFWTEAPGPCWGSPEKVKEWAKRFEKEDGEK